MKTIHPLLATIFLSGTLSGCTTTQQARSWQQARSCQREGPAHLGETVYVNGPSVRPERLIEDSRCPVGLQCVQAGTVRVAVAVIAGHGAKEIEMTLGKPERVADGMLTLLSVAPQKRNDETIAGDQYRFTFDFKGGL